MKKIMELYSITFNISELYGLLGTLILNNYQNTSQYNDTLEELRYYLQLESNIYNNLTLEEINNFILKINKVLSNDSIMSKLSKINFIKDTIYRMFNKLTEKRDILSGDVNTVKISYQKFNISDIFIADDYIEAYIIIETYRKIWSKIISTSVTSKNEKIFKDRLIQYYNIAKIKEASAFSLIELFGINCNFSIEKLVPFDINFIINNEEIGEIILSECTARLINLLEIVEDISDNDNSLDDIFEALVILSEIETILPILNEDNLNEVIEFYNDNIDDDKSDLVASSVKRLIRKKEEELY